VPSEKSAVRHDPQHSREESARRLPPTGPTGRDRGLAGPPLVCATGRRSYAGTDEPIDILMKVETHNHQRDLPVSRAGTGSRWGDSRRGRHGTRLEAEAGSSVHRLEPAHPGRDAAWEQDLGKPDRMLPRCRSCSRGRSRGIFHNEFGPPGICGYFRHVRAAVEGARPFAAARLPNRS